MWRRLNGFNQRMCANYKAYEEQFRKLWEKWEASLGAGEGAPNCLKKYRFLNGLDLVVREIVREKFPDSFEQAVTYARAKDKKMTFQA